MGGFQALIRSLLRTSGRWSLTKVVIAFCDGDEEVLSRINVDTIVRKIELYLVGLPFGYFLAMKIALFIMEYALPPVSGKFMPMMWMSPERRIRYIQSWADSRFSWKRMTFYALKYLCLKQIYAEPALLEHIGYGPALRDRQGGACTSMVQA
jgi:hypothetical protein